MADSVLELLAKLTRHEQSARDIGSIAEAEAFAAKIQQLLTAHKLDMSEIQFEQREQFEPIDEEMVSARDIGIKRRSKRIEWQEGLAYTIADCNGCQLLITQSSNTVFFVGRTSDRQACAQIYTRFVKLAFDLAEKAAAENRDAQRCKCQASNGQWYNGAVFAHWMRAYRNSFCVGFSSVIQSRFREQRTQMEEAKKAAEGDSCSAMVHLRRDSEAIAAHLEEMFKGRKKSKAKPNIEYDGRNFSGDGYNSGRMAGSSIALANHDLAEKSA